jgi:hypothetical protein
VLAPYSGAPPEIELSGRDLERLERETPVYKTLTAEGANRGAVVFRVNAPPDIVWSIIRDLESYPRWIDDLKEAYIYRREGGNIYVRFLAIHWLGGETVQIRPLGKPLILRINFHEPLLTH